VIANKVLALEHRFYGVTVEMVAMGGSIYSVEVDK